MQDADNSDNTNIMNQKNHSNNSSPSGDHSSNHKRNLVKTLLSADLHNYNKNDQEGVQIQQKTEAKQQSSWEHLRGDDLLLREEMARSKQVLQEKEPIG